MDQEWEQRQAQSQFETQMAIRNLNEVENDNIDRIKSALSRSRVFLLQGNRQAAVTALADVQSLASWQSELGGEVQLEYGMALETLQRTEEAMKIYSKLVSTTWSGKIRKQALNLMQGLEMAKQAVGGNNNLAAYLTRKPTAVDSASMKAISEALRPGLTDPWAEYDKDRSSKKFYKVTHWYGDDDGMSLTSSSSAMSSVNSLSDAYRVLRLLLNPLKTVSADLVDQAFSYLSAAAVASDGRELLYLLRSRGALTAEEDELLRYSDSTLSAATTPPPTTVTATTIASASYASPAVTAAPLTTAFDRAISTMLQDEDGAVALERGEDSTPPSSTPQRFSPTASLTAVVERTTASLTAVVERTAPTPPSLPSLLAANQYRQLNGTWDLTASSVSPSSVSPSFPSSSSPSSSFPSSSSLSSSTQSSPSTSSSHATAGWAALYTTLLTSVWKSSSPSLQRYQLGDLRRDLAFGSRSLASVCLETSPTLWGLATMKLQHELCWEGERRFLTLSGSQMSRSIAPYENAHSDKQDLQVR